MRQASGGDADKRPGKAGATPRPRPRLLLVACGLALAAQTAVAGDGSSASQVAAPAAGKPRVRGNLLVPVRQQLSLGFFPAQSRIRTHPACSALFGPFEADGAESLARLRFDGAAFESSSNACGRGGVPACTKVGSHLIRLCPGFAVLTLPKAAVTVIHEALHSAGMTEKPAGPNGPRPQQINQMVKVSCGL